MIAVAKGAAEPEDRTESGGGVETQTMGGDTSYLLSHHSGYWDLSHCVCRY